MNWVYAAALLFGFVVVLFALLRPSSAAVRRIGVGAGGVGIAGLSASFAGLGVILSILAAAFGAALLLWWAESTASA